MLMKRKNLVIVAIVAVALCAVTPMVFESIAISTHTKTVPNAGKIMTIGVGIYSDQACVNAISSIDWGTVSPGSNMNETVYIRNEGNSAATLAMTVSNWNPSNSPSYMTLRWDYTGQSVSKGQVIQVKFTLGVSSSISGITSFGFNMTITANG
jgi:hypothetical protein